MIEFSLEVYLSLTQPKYEYKTGWPVLTRPMRDMKHNVIQSQINKWVNKINSIYIHIHIFIYTGNFHACPETVLGFWQSVIIRHHGLKEHTFVLGQ